MITWDEPTERYFQHGVDRGVLYSSVPGVDAVAWNGITGVSESGNGSSTTYYIDGQIYLADVDATDFNGALTAYFFPDEFAECAGIPMVAEGLFADNQKPKRFDLSYRSLIGSGLAGDMFGYQIHLVYNAMATIGNRERKTLNNSPSPMEFTFGLQCTPVKMPGLRPSAHYVLDTRFLDPDTIAELEDILYEEGRLPDPTELLDMLSFGAEIVVTHNTTAKTINFKGSRTNVVSLPGGLFQVNNVNAVDNGDGTFTVSDGGDTSIIVV